MSCKIWVLKWPWSTMLCRVTHMTILAEITCVVNVKKLFVPLVCHRLVSNVWQILPVYWLTTECLVDQFVQGTSISRQYESKLVPFHQCFPILPFWFGDRPSKDWKPCVIALPFYLPIRKTFPRIFEHVVPRHRATQLFSHVAFPILVNFVVPAEIRDSNIFLYSSIIVSFGLHSRWVHPEWTWSRKDVGSSISTFFINIFHTRVKFSFFPANLMSST